MITPQEARRLEQTLYGIFHIDILHTMASNVLQRDLTRPEFIDWLNDYYRRHPGEPGAKWSEVERSQETPKGWKA